MADWMREITLQKVHGLGPNEAAYWVEREDGMTMSESAERHGVTFYTVRTSLWRAKMKIAGEAGDKDMLILVKGRDGDVRDGVKYPASMVLLGLASRIMEVPVHELDSTAVMILPRRDGDLAWMQEHVFRYFTMEGTYIQDAPALADKMYAKFQDEDGTPDKMGIAVIRYWLDKWYMSYDVLGVE